MQPIGVVGALDVAVHLGAEEALRERVVGVAAHRTARPCSTVTSIAHVSGQSCGQAPRTTPESGSGAPGSIAGELIMAPGGSR